ncbi:MAG: hypothetical protein ACLFMU_03700 [Bacteroidales bacterium]
MPLHISKSGIFATILILFCIIFFDARQTQAQSDNSNSNSNGRISVFLDTHRWMDTDYIREEIPLVNYVRDKEVADVHIIITRHGAGSAGTNYAISFIGRRGFPGMDYDMTYWAPSTNTSDDTRRGYTNAIKVGLVPYIAKTNLADRVLVDFDYDEKARVQEDTHEPEKDPWNSWVFEVYGGFNFSSEEKRSNISSRFGFFADRVTTDWKVRLRPYLNFTKQTFVTDDGEIVRSSHRHGYHTYVVRSINNHWSMGLFASGNSSTYNNYHFTSELVPAIEYSYFPYNEATRRSITLAYRMGYAYQNYIETTIFQKDEEFLLSHSLEASARFQQPWGTFRGGISGSHYFHDFSYNRAEIFGNISLRIFQGFSLNLQAEYEIINDLISIPAGDLPLEDILLAQRQQATSFSVSGSIGISYTFGSDFSAAYNPRL